MDFLEQEDLLDHWNPRRLKDSNLKLHTSNSRVRTKKVWWYQNQFSKRIGVRKKIAAKRALWLTLGGVGAGCGGWGTVSEKGLSPISPFSPSSLCRDRESLGTPERFVGSESRENLCLSLWEKSKVFHYEKIWDQLNRKGSWVCLGRWPESVSGSYLICRDLSVPLNVS